MLHETLAHLFLPAKPWLRCARAAAPAKPWPRCEYIALVWASRYPHPMPAASGGWPYQPSVGLVEMTSKVRKIK
jgi:hypothetical protein